jgi:hypothetical protein
MGFIISNILCFFLSDWFYIFVALLCPNSQKVGECLFICCHAGKVRSLCLLLCIKGLRNCNRKEVSYDTIQIAIQNNSLMICPIHLSINTNYQFHTYLYLNHIVLNNSYFEQDTINGWH